MRMANCLPQSVVDQMQAHFDAGFGIRETARSLGISKITVTTHYHRRGEKCLCLCGADLLHRGWCSYRVSRSAGRQVWLSRLNILPHTRKKWLEQAKLAERTLIENLASVGIANSANPADLYHLSIDINRLRRACRENSPASAAVSTGA